MEILCVENLSFSYPNSDKKAVDNVTFGINRGDFVVLCGESGCGKTTLLRLLKKEISPVGEIRGKIFFNDDVLSNSKENASQIGFVMQNPDNQIVTDKVWHELAFGLENMGLPNDVIRRRVGEMASYFGIQDWFRKSTNELSGGQKQILNLASVMVMQPEILILDEPTSQLDPITASEFITTLQKLNREFGITVILAEHRLEEVFPIADKLMIMEKGSILLYESPRTAGKTLYSISSEHPMLMGMPSAVRIFNKLSHISGCPITVKEGKELLDQYVADLDFQPIIHDFCGSGESAVELKNVWFRYEKDSPDVLRDTSFRINKGEMFCILGGNGSGKTTLLNVITGLEKAYRGKVLINGKPIKEYKGNSLYRQKLAFLPQNPISVFVNDTVRADLIAVLEAMDIAAEQFMARINAVSEKLGLSEMLDMHPYDLSGGEQQKCALAKLLLLEPETLLLDEPTKGLDAYSKHKLAKILKALKHEGVTLLIVSHDVEFAAENADRCAMFFDGEIFSADVPQRFFAENTFYTTAANRMARHKWKNAVTCEQVVECADKCRGKK